MKSQLREYLKAVSYVDSKERLGTGCVPHHGVHQAVVLLILGHFTESCIENVCLVLVRQPPVGQGLFIHDVSKSHTTHHIR